MSNDLLLTLRERVRRIERPAAAVHGVLPFGVTAIDRTLPGGGLARGAVHELLGMGGDEEDGALAAAFAAGILGRLERDGIVLWCLPRPDLYGPGLAVLGLDPARLVLVRAWRDAEILWAIEEGLRATGVAAVVGEVGAFPAVASRRLQLAAERSGVTAFVLRRWRDGARAARERGLPNAAATRWRIAALPSQPVPIPSPAYVIRHPRESGDLGATGASLEALGPRFPHATTPWAQGAQGDDIETEPGIGRPRWRVELLRCRGGAPACWEVEVADAAGSLSLVATLADQPHAPFREDVFIPEKFRRTG
jgi:protein ImuA